MVNLFESIEDLAYHAAISACVPFFTKLSPWVSYKGEYLCDGGFTGKLAIPVIYIATNVVLCAFVPFSMILNLKSCIA